MRKRLKHLGDWFSEQIAPHGFRVFSDSAPILEKHLAEKLGSGGSESTPCCYLEVREAGFSGRAID